MVDEWRNWWGNLDRKLLLIRTDFAKEHNRCFGKSWNRYPECPWVDLNSQPLDLLSCELTNRPSCKPHLSAYLLTYQLNNSLFVRYANFPVYKWIVDLQTIGFPWSCFRLSRWKWRHSCSRFLSRCRCRPDLGGRSSATLVDPCSTCSSVPRPARLLRQSSEQPPTEQSKRNGPIIVTPNL